VTNVGLSDAVSEFALVSAALVGLAPHDRSTVAMVGKLFVPLEHRTFRVMQLLLLILRLPSRTAAPTEAAASRLTVRNAGLEMRAKGQRISTARGARDVRAEGPRKTNAQDELFFLPLFVAQRTEIPGTSGLHS
jgi:hypothetical protein